MFFEELQKAWGGGQLTATHLGLALLRLLSAAFLGTVISYRPWRRFLAHAPVTAVETRQAQVLIAVAGAEIVLVIGDNVARAFSLVGLGGFIRFRSGIKDPREAAVLFVLIGIGMACGLCLVGIAALST